MFWAMTDAESEVGIYLFTVFYRLALTHISDMEKASNIDIRLIQPEPEFEEGNVGRICYIK